ncbi:MAG TPA: carboxypeptidase regulatory-like domain-containing protein [Steroidobacteraceae bacterium]
MAFSPASATAQGQRVDGRVEAIGGVPLGYAEVQLVPTGPRAITDRSGNFDLGVLSPGDHILRVRRLGFVMTTLRITVPLSSPHLTVIMAPTAMLLDTVRTMALELELPRVFQRQREHLGAVAFGPDLLKKYDGMSIDKILQYDFQLSRHLHEPKTCGSPLAAFIDGLPIPLPIGNFSTGGGPEALQIANYVRVRDIAAVEVFNSPDFVHEPFIDGHFENTCMPVILIWTKGYQQERWAGH